MRIAVIGSRGTLGRALTRQAHAGGHELVYLDRPAHDLTDFGAITHGIATSGVDVVVHPAAYTNVDGAESDPAAAFSVNALGTRNVAIGCAEANIPLIYISTNMVFDGTKRTPYTEFDQPNPKGVYATSKRAGEMYVEHLMSKFFI